MHSFKKRVFSVLTEGLPYIQLARLDKPTGAFLVLLPTLWGLALAHGGVPPFSAILLFSLAAFLVRGAGCTANDYLDRDLDRLVARTKSRPLARGAVTPHQALVFLVLQLLAAASLLFFLPPLVFFYALGAVALLITYPLLKRVTYWPQLFLGFCMNYGLLMAYVSVHGELSLNVLILYVGAVLWTLGYDTVYGHQDKEDDQKAGVKSTALLAIGTRKTFISFCYGLFLTSVTLILWMNSAGLWGYGVIMIATIFSCIGIGRLTLNDPISCWRFFQSNVIIGFLICCAFIL